MESSASTRIRFSKVTHRETKPISALEIGMNVLCEYACSYVLGPHDRATFVGLNEASDRHASAGLSDLYETKLGPDSPAEIRPEEQSEKAKSFRENLWNEIQLKGP